MPLKNSILTAVGCLALALGVLGVFLPIMPTVPFILLAAACFSRSSPRFHQWLLAHKYMGPIVRQYEEGQGLPRRIKVRVIFFTWAGMLLSMFIVGQLWAVALLTCIGLGVSIYIWRLPNAKPAA